MTESAATRRPARNRPRRDDTRLAVLFIAPAATGFGVFIFWPLIRGIQFSFTDYNLLTPAKFVGFDNYVRMVHDPVFWNAVRVTLYYVVLNIGIQTVVALVIAVLMQRLTQSSLVRGLVLTPYLMANVIAALLFLWILDYKLGIGNQVLEWLGLDRIAFWGDENWVIPTAALVNVWRHVGYTALLIFAGLQTIPPTVYEAAKLDGASETSMFFRITVPLLRPILALVLIVTMVGSFQIFDTIAVTTAGGPGDSSRVLQMYIYDLAFGRFQFGYAFAMSVALLLILATVTFLQYRLIRADATDLD
ncbi:sugar ABC transporter permease [Gordonia sp. PKS22-38]|uniref:Sugar ABC transporter permease n=1 Tax=Gordonia prachuapensis TaxID=3115651 RepID=A0ABU7MSP9_9ACTN|nr:sugar ABC transporter permease [Gordonia sp. PKS22-38]